MTGNDSPVVLWRGFRHQWRYNHAPTRLGSRVRHDRRDPETLRTEYRVQHSGAGDGSDTLTQRDRFTEMQVRGVFGRPRTLELELPAGGGSVSAELEMVIPAGHDPARGSILAFLNGFDIQLDPAGLQQLSLTLEAPVGRDLAPGAPWIAMLHAHWRPDPRAGTRAGARLTAEVLVLFADREALRSESAGTCQQEYTWDVETPVEREDHGIHTVLFDSPELWPRRRAEIALGFRGLSLFLRAEGSGAPAETLRFLEWDLGVRRLRWQEDAVRAELEMFFKNWRPGMDNAQPPDSRRSRRQAGAVTLGVEPVLLQLDREATLVCEHRQRIASEPSALDTSQPPWEEAFQVTGR